MFNKTIKHEVKLQPSVIVILGLLALGVCGNAFAPAFSVKDAFADKLNYTSSSSPLYIDVKCKGC